jgi:hypothetical protein
MKSPIEGASAEPAIVIRVDDVAGAHDAPAAQPLADRPRHELERRERHEVRRDRRGHLTGGRVEGVAQLRD